MIVVRVEMWRQGNPNDVYPLGEVRIANDGTSRDPKRGSYVAEFRGRHGRVLPSRTVAVVDWPRLARPVFSLLKRALDAAGF